MAENNNGDEQTDTIINIYTELAGGSRDEQNENEYNNIEKPSSELVSANFDDGTNTNAEIETVSNTIIDHHLLAFNELATPVAVGSGENYVGQCINENETFNEQNTGIQTFTAGEQQEIDHYDVECNEDYSDASNEHETSENSGNDATQYSDVQEKALVADLVTDQLKMNIPFTTILETNAQHHQERIHEATTARSDSIVPPHQLDKSKPTDAPKPTTKRETAIELLGHKVTHILQTDHYSTEVDYIHSNIAFNILLIGAPRIGKSSLVNALTGNTINLAVTSAHLGACTVKPDKYEIQCELLEDASHEKRCKVFVWDTKGIEDWDKQSGMNTMFELIKEIQPICVIFCASPGSFANLTQVKMVLDYCNWRKILCAAVLTNMWGGSKDARTSVMNDLKDLFSRFGPQRDWEFSDPDPNLPRHIVHVFGDKGLCTMVNSTPFASEFTTKVMPVRGIDELTHCIMQLLSAEQLQGWCQAVLGNRSFFEKIHQQANGFILERWSFLRELAVAVVDSMENNTKTLGARFFEFFHQLTQ